MNWHSSVISHVSGFIFHFVIGYVGIVRKSEPKKGGLIPHGGPGNPPMVTQDYGGIQMERHRSDILRATGMQRGLQSQWGQHH